MDYIHGCDRSEQERLIAQAQFWQSRVLLRQNLLQPGERMLEIGCGVGAVLGILGQHCPGVSFAGIDLQAEQIDYARQHLSGLGVECDLRVGDAAHLPWPDQSFDQVYAVWFLEHLDRPERVLEEAYRVLKPGGRIILTETDYATLLVWPPCGDFQALMQALQDLFIQAGGNPYIGRRLAPLLLKAGFTSISNTPWGFHFFSQPDDRELQDFVAYLDEIFNPLLEQMQTRAQGDRTQLQRGLEHLTRLPSQPEGTVSVTIYRATGVKPITERF